MKRRDFLKLLGLVPAAALLPKVTQPEAPKPAPFKWPRTAWSQDMIDDSRVVDWAQALARGVDA